MTDNTRRVLQRGEGSGGRRHPLSGAREWPAGCGPFQRNINVIDLSSDEDDDDNVGEAIGAFPNNSDALTRTVEYQTQGGGGSLLRGRQPRSSGRRPRQSAPNHDAYDRGLARLLDQLESKDSLLQREAACTLFSLAANEDKLYEVIRLGGLQKLQDGEFVDDVTKDCVANTLDRVEDKICGQFLFRLLSMMRGSKKVVQRRVALALAHLCSPNDQRTIFIDNDGLELLLGLLSSPNQKRQVDGAMALYKLANKASTFSIDSPSPKPLVNIKEKYLNSMNLSDVTFIIEGREFYAHRICLASASDTFCAMLDSGFREQFEPIIEIPNIRWEVFEMMMRFIYTGSVDVTSDVAPDLLKAADQYLLEGLKLLCEYKIAEDISLENVSTMYELSEAYQAMSLRQRCILFILGQFDKFSVKPWCSHMIQRILPEIKNYFAIALTKTNSHRRL